jgi:hypothetical protein
MIFYDSKHLSQSLKINPARWKRWARTFLAPDPLGGLQSGVARQFNVKDAFKVYLGGYLVGDLNFAIPDAAQVLDDLSNWLKNNGFYAMPVQRNGEKERMHCIYIFKMSKGRFGYCVRTIVSTSAADENGVRQEVFLQTLIAAENDPIASGEAKSATVLAITSLYTDFLDRIE